MIGIGLVIFVALFLGVCAFGAAIDYLTRPPGPPSVPS